MEASMAFDVPGQQVRRRKIGAVSLSGSLVALLAGFEKPYPLIFLLAGWLLLLTACGLTSQAAGARLSLKQDTYDFGKISATQQVVKELEFTNTGAEPLVIKDVLPMPPAEGG